MKKTFTATPLLLLLGVSAISYFLCSVWIPAVTKPAKMAKPLGVNIVIDKIVIDTIYPVVGNRVYTGWIDTLFTDRTKIDYTYIYEKNNTITIGYNLFDKGELIVLEYKANVKPEDVSKQKQLIKEYCATRLLQIRKLKSQIK